MPKKTYYPILAPLSISRQKLSFKNPSVTLSTRGMTNGLTGLILFLQALFVWYIGSTPGGEDYQLQSQIIAGTLALLGIFFIWESGTLNKLTKLEGEIDPEKNKQRVLAIAKKLGWRVMEDSEEAVLMICPSYLGYTRQVSVLFDDSHIWINVSPFKYRSITAPDYYPGSYFGNRKKLKAFKEAW
jgi:hypothetical protein